MALNTAIRHLQRGDWEKAHAIVFNSTRNAVLVPHTGPNVIYAFHWSEKKRALYTIATAPNT